MNRDNKERKKNASKKYWLNKNRFTYFKSLFDNQNIIPIFAIPERRYLGL